MLPCAQLSLSSVTEKKFDEKTQKTMKLKLLNNYLMILQRNPVKHLKYYVWNIDLKTGFLKIKVKGAN